MKLLLTGAFSYTPEQIKELKELAGEVIYIKDESAKIDSDVSDIDIVVCNGLFLYNPIEQFKRLKFIQLTSAGLDRIPLDYIKAAGIKVENAKGVYGIPVAEWIILMILQLFKKSRAFIRQQSDHEWIKHYDLFELSGKTAIIIGFGSIGRETAKRLKAFDVYVIGVDVALPTDEAHTTAHIKPADELYTYDRLDYVLGRADILILTLPLTDETRRMINGERLSRLKSSCILINASRGGLIDERALVEALEGKRLGGAALDVFENEPIGRESPLWDMENVIITPHNSFVSDKNAGRLYSLIVSNIKNFISEYNRQRVYSYCIVTTMSSSVNNWIKPFLPLYYRNGFDVTVVCGMTNEYRQELIKEYPYVNAISVPMPRGIDIAGSLKAIFLLYKVFRKGKYHMVQYSTPNASFYAAVASFLARIPIRLYCQWGMVFVTMKGIRRLIFQTIERLVCLLSTHVQPDSRGNLNYCRQRGFYSREKSCLIWNGSAKGVDLNRFDIKKKEIYRRETRSRYGIGEDCIVIGYVGRLGAEKGCAELFEAFRRIEGQYPKLKLLFVGPFEKEGTIDPGLLDWFYKNSRIIKTGWVPDVERYMAAMDIFILPSYREGFGMSVAEAQAMGVPVIVTDIPGPVNAMAANVTGLTVPVKDAKAIADAVEKLVEDERKRKEFGKAGHEFVKSHFDAMVFAGKLIKNRIELVKECYENKDIDYRERKLCRRKHKSMA